MATRPSLFFMSHMQRGLAQVASPSGEVTASLVLRSDGHEETVEKSMPLLRPKDVSGIASAQVLRRVPAQGSTDMEPNIFPSIEFRLPDLPWMFSPASSADAQQINPWIVLVVVELQTGVALRDKGETALPVLQIRAPALVSRELPDLGESWAWAHVQSSADLEGQSAVDAYHSLPDLFRSRLMCPRRLQPLTDYIACVVPATMGGVQKGLKLNIGQNPDAPAWAGYETSLDLPVYISWKFRTAERGDFEALVTRLSPQELTAGAVPLDISQPGDTRLPGGDKASVTFRGALVGTSAKGQDWESGYQAAYLDGMAQILATHRPGKAADAAGEYNALRDDPVVAPPLWGAAKIGAAKAPPPPGNDADWFSELNYHPAHRAAAGLGAEAVRRNQEELMAEAWRQVEGLREVNRVLTQTRLASETSGALYKGKIKTLSGAEATCLAGPALARIAAQDEAPTLKAALGHSTSPTGIYSPAMSRLARRKGPIGKAVVKAGFDISVAATCISWFSEKPALAGKFRDFAEPAQLGRSDFLATLSLPGLPANQVRTAKRHLSGNVSVRSVAEKPTLGARRSVQPQQRATMRVSARRLSGPGAVSAETRVLDTAIALAQASYDPVPVLSARLRARVKVPESVLKSTRLPAPYLVEPRFDIAGYTLLRAINPDCVIPGVGAMALNTVGLATVNSQFVESWLLGANAELAREMLWREYPGRLNGTYFHRFWDTPGAGDDIGAIAGWKAGSLGEHQTGAGTDDTLVLLVKGEVLARYPGLRLYASRATWGDQQFRTEAVLGSTPLETKQPVFGGWLNQTTAFFAFDLSLPEARGTLDYSGQDPGWFFVFEQPKEGVQFGLDVPPASGQVRKPQKWEDLHWAHALDEPAGQGEATHISVARGVGAQNLPYAEDAFYETWGRSSSAQARITLQRPMRVLFHASAMLPFDPGLPGGS